MYKLDVVMKNNELTISHPPTSEIYKSILDILRQEKIRQLSDLKNIEITAQRAGFEFIESDRYPWAKEIFEIVEREFSSLLTSCQKIPNPKIVSDRLYSFAGEHNWTIDDKIFPLRAKYSCFFPKRILYLSHQFIHWDEYGDFCPNDYWIPVDFLSLVIALSPVLLENLAFLLPTRINYIDEIGASSSGAGNTYDYREAKGIITIPASGHGYDSLHELMAQGGIVELESQLVETPWLLGARTEDYVELIQKYPDEFYLFSDSLGKFINGSNNPEILAEWIKDVSVSVRQLVGRLA